MIVSKCFGGSAFVIAISGLPVARAKLIPDDVDAEIYEKHGQEQQKRSAHKLSSAAIRKRFDPKENSFSWSRRPRSTLPSVVLRVLSFTFFQAILREVVKLFVARGARVIFCRAPVRQVFVARIAYILQRKTACCIQITSDKGKDILNFRLVVLVVLRIEEVTPSPILRRARRCGRACNITSTPIMKEYQKEITKRTMAHLL